MIDYKIKIHHPIITSILDSDLYKQTMCSVAFTKFPRVNVTYTFINRGKTKFPKGFAEELINQINMISELQLTSSEFKNLNNITYMLPTYIEWFKGYRYDRSLILEQT